MIMFNVLKRPILTEKTTSLRAESRKVVVEADVGANKHQIKLAAEKLFNVKVENVNTMLIRGKTKRVGKSTGRQSNYKKAVLTIAAGSDLDVFGVQMGVPPAQPQE